MGLHVRRSVKIGKHTRLNISKSGIGVSTGVKGVRIGVGPRGVRETVGIPGTGLYYTKQQSRRQDSSAIDSPLPVPQGPLSKAGKIGFRILAVFLFLITAFLALCGIPILPVGIILWIGAAVFGFLGWLCVRKTL